MWQRYAKTEDDCVRGWPADWNGVAIYVWLLDVGPLATTCWVVLFTLAVCVPLKYIYPSKMRVLKRTTAALALGCMALVTYAVLNPDRTESRVVVWLSLAFPAYYLVLSFRRGGFHRASR